MKHPAINDDLPLLPNCYKVTFVEQSPCENLDWCEDKRIHRVKASINLDRMILPDIRWFQVLFLIQFCFCILSIRFAWLILRAIPLAWCWGLFPVFLTLSPWWVCFIRLLFFQAFLLFIIISLIFNLSSSLIDYGGFSLMLFSFFISFLFVFGFKCLLILLCHFVLACLSVSLLFSGVPFNYSFSVSGMFYLTAVQNYSFT